MKKFIVTLFFAFCATASFASVSEVVTPVDLESIQTVEISIVLPIENSDTESAALWDCHFVTMCGNTGLSCCPEDAAFYFKQWCGGGQEEDC